MTVKLLRITPGAGKTHVVARWLGEYCRPIVDGAVTEAGRTAVMAFPTNALMEEVSESLKKDGIGHTIRTGVMGVPDRDGVPACQKRPEALRVIEAGGNVHRALCARCEFKDGCPAREGVERSVAGGGTLVLTNHALCPSVVSELRARGRLPYVVYDESPKWVDDESVSWDDLEFARERLALDAANRADGGGVGVVGAMARSAVYGKEYSDAAAMLLEVLEPYWRGDGDGWGEGIQFEAALAVWGRLPVNRARIRGVGARLGLEVLGPEAELGADEFDRVLDASERSVDAGSIPYDELGGADRVAVERVWRAVGGLRVWGQPGGRFWTDRAAAAFTARSRAVGALGSRGVVLDATAGVETFRAAVGASGAGVEVGVADLVVGDAPGIERVWHERADLSKNKLGLMGGGGAAASESGAEVGAEARRRALEPVVEAVSARIRSGERVVVFTYSDLVPQVVEMIKVSVPGETVRVVEGREGGGNMGEKGTRGEIHYYGNSRGYNRWYEQGFTGYVTIGDPYPNVGAVDRAASTLGLDTELYGLEHAQGELEQCHGRARDPRPGPPRWHWHFGRVQPRGWGSRG